MKLLIYTKLLVGLIFVSDGATIKDELEALKQQVHLQEVEVGTIKRKYGVQIEELKQEVNSMKGMVH